MVLEVENYVPFLDSTAYSCGAKTKDTLFRQFAAVSAVPRKPHPASSGLTGAGVPVCVGGPGDAGADPIAVPPPAVAGPDVAVVEDDDTRRNLKLEALSLEHLLTHFPKNKYCSACQRARLRRRPIGVVRQDKGEAAVEFGDVITCDHIIASKDEAEGLLTDKTAMTIYDMGTHFTGCYPLKTKGADDAYRALQHFRGPRGTFHYVYSDNSGEIWKAVDMLGFPQGTSTPGIHETNSHIERRNETILGGTRTVLESAGFPSCFWPLASAYFCHMLNIKLHEGDSAWNLRHKNGHFKGLRIPFGCAVDFIPNVTKKKWKVRNKWTSSSIPGVFMGYKLLPGHKWSGEFFVAAIEDLKSLTLRLMPRAWTRSSLYIPLGSSLSTTHRGTFFPYRSDMTRRIDLSKGLPRPS